MATRRPASTDTWQYVATLAGALAHEIKNPLGTIHLNLQLLEEDWADPQTPKEKRTVRKLRALQREVHRLAQLLEDFLRFVRMDELHLEPTDINELAAEIAEFIEPELARAKIELREQYTPGLAPCPADRKLLKQAILNIILNAQQAMPRGGELILRTSAADDAVHIEIIDTGPGVPEHIRDKIFDAFFSTKPGGSGLGLAMTQRIVQQHGGTLRFHSEPGTGTDFIISIPTANESAGNDT